jgi:hypothetical protein
MCGIAVGRLPFIRIMNLRRRAELIECAAKRQFKVDFPNCEWSGVEAPSLELDRRAGRGGEFLGF